MFEEEDYVSKVSSQFRSKQIAYDGTLHIDPGTILKYSLNSKSCWLKKSN